MPSAAASTAPSTTSPGALSPPSASTAIRGIRVSLRTEPERLDLTATIGAAGRADAVRALRRAALRAGVDARCLERVLGTALVPARLRRLSLRNGHRRRSVAATLPSEPPGSSHAGPLGRIPLLVPSPTEGGPPVPGLQARDISK